MKTHIVIMRMRIHNFVQIVEPTDLFLVPIVMGGTL